MALTVSAWAQTTFQGQILDALKEANVLGSPSSIAVYNYEVGVPSKRFPRIAARTATHAADGTELTTGNVTETAATCTLDIPLKTHELVEYSVVNANGTAVPNWYARSLGRTIEERRQNIFLAYAMIVAAGETGTGLSAGTDVRNDGNGLVNFDNEDTDGSSIADAVLDAMAQMSADKVSTAGRTVVLHPTYYNKLRKVNYIAGVDFNGGGSSNVAGSTFSSFNFGGCRIVSLASVFGTSLASDTDLVAKYRGNFTAGGVGTGGIWGVMFSNEALAWHEAERPGGYIDDIPDKDSWLVKARCQFGLATLRPTGVIAFQGDNGS